MNTKVISAIAFKLFAIYIVVSTVLAIPVASGIFTAMKRKSDSFEVTFFWPAIIIVFSVIVTIVLFRVLWKLGDNVINSISEVNVTDKEFDVLALEKSLFIFLGLYFSITAFVELPNISTSLWVYSHTSTGARLKDYAGLLSLIVQLIIGLSLIKKPNQWLLLIKNAGLHKKSL